MTDIPDVNATRLKDMLVAEIPQMEAYTKGRDVLLAFKGDICPVLADASDYSDAIILAKAAKMLRRQMVDHKCKFDGTFHDSCTTDSEPPILLQFVCMIEHGADIQSQLRFGASTTDLALAQLLQYNCLAKAKEGAASQRHSKERETPFPLYIGLSVYAKTRKRHLVELLHNNGISILYDRVLEISAQLGDAVVSRYVEEGVVCPPQLRKGLNVVDDANAIVLALSAHSFVPANAMRTLHNPDIQLYIHLHTLKYCSLLKTSIRTSRNKHPALAPVYSIKVRGV